MHVLGLSGLPQDTDLFSLLDCSPRGELLPPLVGFVCWMAGGPPNSTCWCLSLVTSFLDSWARLALVSRHSLLHPEGYRSQGKTPPPPPYRQAAVCKTVGCNRYFRPPSSKRYRPAANEQSSNRQSQFQACLGIFFFFVFFGGGTSPIIIIFKSCWCD